ncbi:MAG: hypothetical protein VCC99_01740, partial [Alphaproteobacteria bacterium]
MFEARDCIAWFTLVHQRDREVGIGLVIVGAKFDCLGEVIRRLFLAMQRVEGRADIVVRGGMVRGDTQGR